MMFTLATVIANWLTIQSYYPTQTADIFNISLLVAPKANDGHASPFIDRNLRKKYAAQIAGNGVSGLQISKNFRGACPRTPLVMRGLGATVSFGAA